MEEAAARKARLPTVESLTDGTMRRLVAAERMSMSTQYGSQNYRALDRHPTWSRGRPGSCKCLHSSTVVTLRNLVAEGQSAYAWGAKIW